MRNFHNLIMRRSRGYTRRYTRRIKTVKYSNETTNASGDFTIADGNQQLALPLIAPSNVQGTRKCKNFELSLCGGNWTNTDADGIPISWALVYVPEGTQPGDIRQGALGTPASLYEPAQNVIMSGIWPGNLTSNYKVKTRLARNLNSGDSIFLVFRTSINQPDGAQKSVVVNLNYAIAY